MRGGAVTSSALMTWRASGESALVSQTICCSKCSPVHDLAAAHVHEQRHDRRHRPFFALVRELEGDPQPASRLVDPQLGLPCRRLPLPFTFAIGFAGIQRFSPAHHLKNDEASARMLSCVSGEYGLLVRSEATSQRRL
jgi:hypothetical protein